MMPYSYFGLVTGCIMLAACCYADDDHHEIYRTTGCGIVDVATVITEQSFTSAAVERLAHEFLVARGGRAGLFRVTWGTTPNDVESALGQNPAHVDTTQRIEQLRTAWPPTKPIATLIGLDGAAVLVANDGKGNVTRKVIAGKTDPTLMRIGTDAFRLLHFHLAVSRGQPPECYTTFYVRAPIPLSIGKCRQLTSRLKQRIGGKEVFVFCLTNNWDIGNPEFPAIYRFEPLTPIPTYWETLTQPAVGCSVGIWQLKCTGRGFVP